MSTNPNRRNEGPSLFKVGLGVALVAGIMKLASDDELREKVASAIEDGATRFGKWLDEKTTPFNTSALAWSSSGSDEKRKEEIFKLDRKRGEIVKQQKMILARRSELLKIRAKAIRHHEWKKEELEQRLLKRGVKSIVRHVVFHAVGSFAGTALALAMDTADAAGFAQDASDAADAVDAIAAALDGIPDFDAFETMQTTWEQMGDMNLVDVDDVDFDSLTDIQGSQDVMNDRLDSLQTCNQGFVDVANQN